MTKSPKGRRDAAGPSVKAQQAGKGNRNAGGFNLSKDYTARRKRPTAADGTRVLNAFRTIVAQPRRRYRDPRERPKARDPREDDEDSSGEARDLRKRRRGKKVAWCKKENSRHQLSDCLCMIENIQRRVVQTYNALIKNGELAPDVTLEAYLEQLIAEEAVKPEYQDTDVEDDDDSEDESEGLTDTDGEQTESGGDQGEPVVGLRTRPQHKAPKARASDGGLGTRRQRAQAGAVLSSDDDSETDTKLKKPIQGRAVKAAAKPAGGETAGKGRVAKCNDNKSDDEADEGRHSSDAEDGPAKRTTRQRAKSTAAQDRQGVAGEGKGEGGDVAGAADKAPARARRTGGAAAAAASSSKAAEAPAETHNQSDEEAYVDTGKPDAGGLKRTARQRGKDKAAVVAQAAEGAAGEDADGAAGKAPARGQRKGGKKPAAAADENEAAWVPGAADGHEGAAGAGPAAAEAAQAVAAALAAERHFVFQAFSAGLVNVRNGPVDLSGAGPSAAAPAPAAGLRRGPLRGQRAAGAAAAAAAAAPVGNTTQQQAAAVAAAAAALEARQQLAAAATGPAGDDANGREGNDTALAGNMFAAPAAEAARPVSAALRAFTAPAAAAWQNPETDWQHLLAPPAAAASAAAPEPAGPAAVVAAAAAAPAEPTALAAQLAEVRARLEGELADLRQAAAVAQAAADELQAANTQRTADSAQLAEQLAAANAAAEKLQAEKAQLAADSAQLAEQLAAAKAAAEQQSAEVERLRADVVRLQQAAEQRTAERATAGELRAEIEQLRQAATEAAAAATEQLAHEKGQLQEQLAEANRKLQQLAAEKAEAVQAATASDAAAQRERALKEAAEHSLTHISNNAERLQEEKSRLQADNRQLRLERSHARQRADVAEPRLKLAQDDLRAAYDCNHRQRRDNDELQAQVHQLRVLAQRLQGQVQQLQSEVEAQRGETRRANNIRLAETFRAKRRASDLLREKQQLQQQLAAAQGQLSALQAAQQQQGQLPAEPAGQQQLHTQLAELEAAQQQLQGQLAELQAELATERAARQAAEQRVSHMQRVMAGDEEDAFDDDALLNAPLGVLGTNTLSGGGAGEPGPSGLRAGDLPFDAATQTESDTQLAVRTQANLVFPGLDLAAAGAAAAPAAAAAAAGPAAPAALSQADMAAIVESVLAAVPANTLLAGITREKLSQMAGLGLLTHNELDSLFHFIQSLLQIDRTLLVNAESIRVILGGVIQQLAASFPSDNVGLPAVPAVVLAALAAQAAQPVAAAAAAAVPAVQPLDAAAAAAAPAVQPVAEEEPSDVADQFFIRSPSRSGGGSAKPGSAAAAGGAHAPANV